MHFHSQHMLFTKFSYCCVTNSLVFSVCVTHSMLNLNMLKSTAMFTHAASQFSVVTKPVQNLPFHPPAGQTTSPQLHTFCRK